VARKIDWKIDCDCDLNFPLDWNTFFFWLGSFNLSILWSCFRLIHNNASALLKSVFYFDFCSEHVVVFWSSIGLTKKWRRTTLRKVLRAFLSYESNLLIKCWYVDTLFLSNQREMWISCNLLLFCFVFSLVLLS
jgi:hypothetical protein